MMGGYFFMFDLDSWFGISKLAASHRADNQERFSALDDFVRQNGVRRFEGQILFAREEADEWSSLQRAVITDRAAQRRIPCFQSIQHRLNRDRACDFKRYLAVRNAGEIAQMKWQHDTDHWKSSKHQAPTSREAPMFKLQTATRPFEVWDLGFLWYLEVGIWSFI